MIKVLIVEDEPLIAKALAKLIVKKVAWILRWPA